MTTRQPRTLARSPVLQVGQSPLRETLRRTRNLDDDYRSRSHIPPNNLPPEWQIGAPGVERCHPLAWPCASFTSYIYWVVRNFPPDSAALPLFCNLVLHVILYTTRGGNE